MTDIGFGAGEAPEDGLKLRLQALEDELRTLSRQLDDERRAKSALEASYDTLLQQHTKILELERSTPLTAWMSNTLSHESTLAMELEHQREILRMKLDCLCRLTGDAGPSQQCEQDRIGGIFNRSPW